MFQAAVVATIVLLLLLFWLVSALLPLRQFKALYVLEYGGLLLVYVGLLIVNVLAAATLLTRTLGLRTAGRKLAHLDKELGSDSALAEEMRMGAADEQ